jgi:hypothetical protein
MMSRNNSFFSFLVSIFFLVVFSFCITSVPLAADDMVDRTHVLYEPELELAGSLMIATELDSAEKVVERFIAANPDRPCGYYFRATAISWRLFLISEDEDPEPLKKSFEQELELSRTMAEQAAKGKETKLEGTLYLAAVYGQQALLALVDHRWLVMAPLAKKAWDYIEKTMEMDPDYYDSYMGRGIYLYFTDALPELVRVLALAFGFEGNRREGLANMWLAASRGLYSRDVSAVMLLNIFSTIEEPGERVLSVAHELHDLYPNNPLIHWRLGDLLLRSDSLAQARQVYNEVSARVESGYRYYDNRMFSRWSMAYRIALCDKKSGELEQALQGFGRITSAPGEIDPKWVLASSYLEQGRIYLMQSKYDLATQSLRRVKKLDEFRDSHDQADELLKKIKKQHQ